MHLLGVDIGGTFTDFVMLRDGQITIHKLPTTPDDPARALLEGVAHLGPPQALIHGTTVATNALLERRGAPTAVLTTAGFADVLVIGRGTRPRLYDLNVQRPPPLVPAAWRIEISERVGADGSVLQPLDETTLMEILQRLDTSEIESVAVCFLHSYCNPTHEQRAVAALEAVRRSDGRARFFVCSSFEVLPEYREYERISTTTVNAYVAPILDRYLERLEQALGSQSVASLRIMSSDGGSMTAHAARRLAARTTLSGPAGGAVGAQAVAQQAGFTPIISFDMGGTSTDVCLIADRLPQTSASYVGDMPVRLPSIDIHTVGAGGGSLARIDMGGALRVGPQSAGSVPGPACYGRGTLPTVTDANLILGRLRADAFLGGKMVLDVSRSEAALLPLAQAMNLDIADVAQGILRVANAAMERAIRAISVEQGYDPRDFTLVAFGGAGPLHAAYLADALDIRRVLVPRYPGVLSALGMLTADITRDYVQFLAQHLDQIDPDWLSQQMQQMAAQGQADMQRDGDEFAELRAVFTLDLRYAGQSHEISTPLIEQRLGNQAQKTKRWELEIEDQQTVLRSALERFHALHQQYSGHAMPDRPVEAVALRLKMAAVTWEPGMWEAITHLPTLSPPPHSPIPYTTVSAVLNGETTQPADTAIYERGDLHPGGVVTGPAIIVQFDTTTVIPAGWQCVIDDYGNTILTRSRYVSE